MQSHFLLFLHFLLFFLIHGVYSHQLYPLQFFVLKMQKEFKGQWGLIFIQGTVVFFLFCFSKSIVKNGFSKRGLFLNPWDRSELWDLQHRAVPSWRSVHSRPFRLSRAQSQR